MPAEARSNQSSRFTRHPTIVDEKQSRIALHQSINPPPSAFVCLGTGGGPLEGDSPAICSNQLTKIGRMAPSSSKVVLARCAYRRARATRPDSAFHDFDFPPTTPSAYLRAGLMASFSSAFLISHAHLDHILGLVLGSASLPGKRSVFGLKPTLENILDMFNGKIWPSWPRGRRTNHIPCITCASLDNQRPCSVTDSLSVLPFALSHGSIHPSRPRLPRPPTRQRSSTRTTSASACSLPVSTQLGSFQLSRGIDDRMRTLESILARKRGQQHCFPSSVDQQ